MEKLIFQSLVLYRIFGWNYLPIYCLSSFIIDNQP